MKKLFLLFTQLTIPLLFLCQAHAGGLSNDRPERVLREDDIFPEQWNNFSPNTAKSLLCFGAKFAAIPSIRSLPPQISSLLKNASDPGGPFNATDVGGGPRTRMKIGARNANTILFVVENGGIGYNSDLYLYGREGTEWILRDTSYFADESSLSLNDFLIESQKLFGCPHARGNGSVENDVEALAVFREAAAHGDASAQFGLGLAYADGRAVAKNNDEAFAWFQRAAATDSSYQYELGLMYANGKVVNKDYAEALRRFRIAADNIHGATAPFAYLQLGQMYYKGRGVIANRIVGFALRNLNPAYINDYSMQDILESDEMEEEMKLRDRMLQAVKHGNGITTDLDRFLAVHSQKGHPDDAPAPPKL